MTENHVHDSCNICKDEHIKELKQKVKNAQEKYDDAQERERHGRLSKRTSKAFNELYVAEEHLKSVLPPPPKPTREWVYCIGGQIDGRRVIADIGSMVFLASHTLKFEASWILDTSDDIAHIPGCEMDFYEKRRYSFGTFFLYRETQKV